jgi:DNA-binding phage protein
LKHYKTKIKELKALTGLNIKEIAEKLGCRRESIYYALRTKGTKSGLKKKIDNLILEKGK